MTTSPPPTEVRSQNPVARAMRAPFEARTWRETLHLLLNLPVSIVTFTVIVAVSLAATACSEAIDSGSAVSGSGNVVTRQIPVTSFSKLEVSGAFTATVSVGSSEAVTVRVDDNLVDSLDVGVSGDTLHVGLKSGTSVTNATLEADVTVRSLEALEGSGASTITLSDALAADTLSFTISGASRLSGPIEIERGSLELSGASEVELSGSATTLGVQVRGASHMNAMQLTIDQLTIDLSGASGADVSVTGSLSASASGASTLRYVGSPAILRSETSGASAIQPLT